MKEKRPFPIAKTLIVGTGFLGISVVWPIFNQFIPLFLQAGNPAYEAQLIAAGRPVPEIDGFGLTPALALFIMTWDNLINVFVQPWVGEKSDHTWNRLGRRKGWILAGVPIAAVGLLLIPFAQTAVAVAVYILITNIGMALFRSPAVAWLGDLYPPEERSQANGLINLMGGIGGLLAFFVGGWLFDNMGREAPFIAGAVMMTAAAAVVLLGVREPRQLATERPSDQSSVLDNARAVMGRPDKSGLFVLISVLVWFIGFNALETGLSSFAVFTLGIPAGQASIYSGAVAVTFILFAVPAGLLGGRYGRLPVVRWGVAGLALIFIVGFFVIQNALTYVLILVVTGLFWSCVNVNSLPLVFDYGDEARIGAYTGLYYFASQSAAVLGPTTAGIMVDLLQNEFRWLFLFSGVFMGLAWVTLRRVTAHTPED